MDFFIGVPSSDISIFLLIKFSTDLKKIEKHKNRSRKINHENLILVVIY